MTDYWSGVKNIFGGRIKNYEKVVNKATEEALEGLYKKAPEVKNVKLQITEFTNGAISVTAYGDIKC